MRITSILAATILAAVASPRSTQADCIAPAASAPVIVNEQLPANAPVGSCFAHVIEPARTEAVTEQVLVKPAIERVEVVPARYETINETVLVEPATTKVVTIPARVEWIEDPIVLEPERTEWRRSACSAPGAVANATGECACKILIPARYGTVPRRVAVAATTKVVDVPARYETVQKTVMASPAHEVRVAVPAEYQVVTRQVEVAGAKDGWQRVDCGASSASCSIDASAVARLQRHLREAGYQPGPLYGVFDAQTWQALRAYQADEGLAQGSCQGVAYLQRIP